MKLVIQSGPMAGQSFPLREGDNLIGRSEGCAIILPDARVSRQHALIRREGNRVTITDLGSTNGTFLNGQRIQAHRSYPLFPGVTITIGNNTLSITGMKARPVRKPGIKKAKGTGWWRPVLALVITFILITVLLGAVFLVIHLFPLTPEEKFEEQTPQMPIAPVLTAVPTLVQGVATMVATIVPEMPNIPIPVGTPAPPSP